MRWRAEPLQWALISKSLGRQMPREHTRAEAMLWARVHGGKLLGMRFRRQHAMGRYIGDFYCEQARLVAGRGLTEVKKTWMRKRDQFLVGHGEVVLRFANLSDIEWVLAGITMMLPIS